jgi:hypothetical protein
MTNRRQNYKGRCMGLENVSMVDAVGTEPASDSVVLSIIDSWDWSDERGHMLALQNKLNSYFGFIESGQMNEAYPTAVGKSLRIDLISRYPLPAIAINFLNNAEAVAKELAISLQWKTVPAGTA